MTMNMKKEIEVKFEIPRNFNENILKDIGAVKLSDFKQEILGFFSKNSIKKGIFPRIRNESDKNWYLTIKIKTKKDSKYFERKEIEIPIDKKIGIEMLKILGFSKIEILHRRRQEWVKGNIYFCIDNFSFGKFLEIEGNKKDIEEMIKVLGLKNKERITKSYLGIKKLKIGG